MSLEFMLFFLLNTLRDDVAFVTLAWFLLLNRLARGRVWQSMSGIMMNSSIEIRDTTVTVIITGVKYVPDLVLEVSGFYDNDVDLHGICCWCYRPDKIWSSKGSGWEER